MEAKAKMVRRESHLADNAPYGEGARVTLASLFGEKIAYVIEFSPLKMTYLVAVGAPEATPEANFFQAARRTLGDEGGFEAFRAELKPLLVCLKALTLSLTLTLTFTLTLTYPSASAHPGLYPKLSPNPGPSLSSNPHAKSKPSRYLTLTHHQAARGLGSPSLVREELHRTLDAVHSLFVRRGLGGLCDEFAAYVPAEGRDYWRTLALASVDGTTGCMERPVSRKENAIHQLAYES